MTIPLDFKHYKVPGDILLLMIKDEIKTSQILRYSNPHQLFRFGYEELNPGNEIFFAVSTNMFKNFDFESTQNQAEQKATNKSAFE